VGIFDALSDGWKEIWTTLTMTFKGLGLMFQGLNPMKALSGPLKITVLIGEVTAQGMTQGLATGIRTFFQILSFLSVALFFGNLLPIPVLDGGQIVVSTAEIIKRSPIGPGRFSGTRQSERSSCSP
jgi:regulator of sigma E protease